MSARQSAAVDLALKLIGRPKPGGGVFTPYAAAKEAGISLSSVYRGMERHGMKPASDKLLRDAAPYLLGALNYILDDPNTTLDCSARCIALEALALTRKKKPVSQG